MAFFRVEKRFCEKSGVNQTFLKLGYKGIDSPFSTTLNDRNTFNFLDIEAVDIYGSPKIKKINIIELESLNAKYISENTSIAWSYKTVIDRHSNQENELSDSSSIGVGIAHTTPRITISYLPEVAISIRENFATPRIKAEAFLYSQQIGRASCRERV